MQRSERRPNVRVSECPRSSSTQPSPSGVQAPDPEILNVHKAIVTTPAHALRSRAEPSEPDRPRMRLPSGPSRNRIRISRPLRKPPEGWDQSGPMRVRERGPRVLRPV